MGEHLRHKEKKTDRNRYFLPNLYRALVNGLRRVPFKDQ